MHKRTGRQFSPETTTLERREVLTSVVKIPLSTFPGPTLNNQGVLVGVLPVKVGTSDTESSFVLQPGPDATPRPIPVLPGDTTTQANALNDAGQVIGISQSNSSAVPSTARAFLYSPKSGTVLIPPLPGFDTVNPTLLTKGGLVAGSDFQSGSSGADYGVSNSTHGFLYSRRRGTVDLGTLPGLPNLLPTAINDRAGLVVGLAASMPDPTFTKPPIAHAFSYNIASRKLTDLGTLPGLDTFGAQFVNARGEIAGTAGISGDSTSGHVFTYRAGRGMKDIGLMTGFDRITLIDQMDDGRLLVQVSNSTTITTHAAIYQDGKGFRDIATLPAAASDINGNALAVTLGRPNKHGLAIVSNVDPQVGVRIRVLNLKTHALTDITSQIGDTQSIRSSDSNPVAINDRDQFLVPISTPGQGTDLGYGDSQTMYLISLDAKGTPVPRSVTMVGVPASPASGVAAATPIPVTPTAMASPLP